jgi:hypothetical protein
MHPLDGAYDRVSRAREHLEDLKPQVNALRQATHNRVSLNRKPGVFTLPDGRRVPAVRGSVSTLIIPAPLRVSTLISEVAQNLRIPLDYLAYELACFDAKRIVDHTQFPVADSEERFKDLLARYNLRDTLTTDHIAAIERLQPLRGCHWIARLGELCNPDKHRHLTGVISPIVITLLPGSTEAILAGKPMHMKHDIAVQIAFSDGTPVVESLEQFHSQVSQVLRDFEPEFERR